MKLKRDLKLLSFDLDDTLVVNGKLSQLNRKVLQKYHDEGIVIIYNTGRHFSLIPFALLQEKFLDYVISSNGAKITEIKSGKVLKSASFDYSTQTKLAQYIKDTDRNLIFTVDRPLAAYSRFISFRIRNKKSRSGKPKYGFKVAGLVQMLKNMKPILNPYQQLLKKENIVEKIDCRFKDDLTAQKAVETINKELGVNATIVQYSNVEITPEGINKGDSLIELCQYLGIEMNKVACFGDSGNDLEMLRVAGLAVAMANSPDFVKQRSHLVIDEARNDGVGKFLLSLIEKQDL